jgi:hypothetical protein
VDRAQRFLLRGSGLDDSFRPALLSHAGEVE